MITLYVLKDHIHYFPDARMKNLYVAPPREKRCQAVTRMSPLSGDARAAKPANGADAAVTQYTSSSPVPTLWGHIPVFRGAALCRAAGGWCKCIFFAVTSEIFFLLKVGIWHKTKQRNHNRTAAVLDGGGYSRLSVGKLGVQSGEVQGFTGLAPQPGSPQPRSP